MKEEKKKSVFMQILESNVVTALITVVIGGIVGQIIITSVQNNAKGSELALTEYRKYLDEQIAVVQQAYDLVGRCISNSLAVLSLTQPEFKLSGIREADRAAVAEQKKKVLEVFNSGCDEWQKVKYKTGLLISYYHYGRSDVLPSWRKLQRGVDEMIACASGHYMISFYDPSKIKSETEICKTDIEKVEALLDQFSRIIESAHRFSWQQMSIPKQ